MTSDDAFFEAVGFPSPEAFRFPTIVNVEVYRSRCPCRCTHCPLGRTPPRQRKARFGEMGMPLSLYDKIADEVARYPGSLLRVHSVGEPLLWRDLASALRSTRRKGVPTWIFSSAVTTNLGLLETVARHTDIIEISVNSTNRADYRATKGVDAFDLVVANLEFLRSAIPRGTTTRLIASRVQSKDRRADNAFVNHWKGCGLVDDAFVRTYHTYNNLLAELSTEPADATPCHAPCLVHWARFNIGVKGDAVVCFNELFKEHLDASSILGDVTRQSIAEIWRGSALSALRRAELSGDYSQLPFADSLPCVHCRSCQPLRGSRPTSEVQVKHLRKE